MTSEKGKPKAESAAMARADIANGEAPDADPRCDEPVVQPGLGKRGSAHPTGEKQATTNRENDPPA